MKLIDEKGRLFGKINVIDFLVILFLISLTPMVYYGYKIFSAPPPPPPLPSLQDYQTQIQTYVLFKNLPEDIARNIIVGDKEFDKDGKIIAEIQSIEKVEPNIMLIGGGQKESDKIVDNTRRQVFVKMLINTNVTVNNQLLYKNEAISENKMIKFNSGKYEINGIIVAPPPPPPPPPPPQKQVILKVRLDSVIPEIYRFIKAGDVMKIPKVIAENTEVPVSNPQKDKKYIKIAEIKRIVSMENVKREFYSLKRDELAQIDHPSLKNITLEIVALYYEEGGQYIFNGRPARLGSTFTFQNENYEINGIILEMNKP